MVVVDRSNHDYCCRLVAINFYQHYIYIELPKELKEVIFFFNLVVFYAFC